MRGTADFRPHRRAEIFYRFLAGQVRDAEQTRKQTRHPERIALMPGVRTFDTYCIHMNPLSATGAGAGQSGAAPDTRSLDAEVDGLLSAQPPPHVVAAAESGLCIPLPPGVPVSPQQEITGIGSALELCLPTEMDAVIKAWERARSCGLGRVRIHLRRDPERLVDIFFADARHRYGVYLGIFLYAGSDGLAAPETPALFRPRLFRVERDQIAVVLRVDSTVEQILGWSPAELVGRRLTDLIHPDEQAQSIATWLSMLNRPGIDQRITVRYRCSDGRYVWLEITHTNLLDDPADPRISSQMLDVSDRMEAVEQLRASEELLRRLTETLPQGVAHIDAEGHVVYRTERLLEIVGRTDVATVDDFLMSIAVADRARLARSIGTLLAHGEPIDAELTIGRDDAVRRCSIAMRALKGESGAMSGAILSLMDITERERLRAEVERRARFDHLTGCQNRAAILESLDAALHDPLGSGNGLAVLFIDLDRFKQVNDEFGHATGDALLRCVGERLIEGARAGDAVGRLGGDEFLVVCRNVDTPETGLDIARRVGTALAEPTVVAGHRIVPGSSIGVAWSDMAIDADALVARADAAMYESKRLAAGPRLGKAASSTAA